MVLPITPAFWAAFGFIESTDLSYKTCLFQATIISQSFAWRPRSCLPSKSSSCALCLSAARTLGQSKLAFDYTDTTLNTTTAISATNTHTRLARPLGLLRDLINPFDVIIGMLKVSSCLSSWLYLALVPPAPHEFYTRAIQYPTKCEIFAEHQWESGGHIAASSILNESAPASGYVDCILVEP